MDTFSAGSASFDSCICLPGREYRADPGTCVLCPKGTYNKGGARSLCQACPSGSYASSVGSYYCRMCITGRTSVASGSTSVSQCACPQGMGFDSTANSCSINCPTGSYNDGTPLGCKKCPLGTFTSSPNAFSCSSCANGLTTAAKGSTSDAQCVCHAGTGCDVAGADPCTCVTCDHGFYNDGTMRQCQACPYSGQTTTSSGSISIHNCTCPAGQALRWWMCR